MIPQKPERAPIYFTKEAAVYLGLDRILEDPEQAMLRMARHNVIASIRVANKVAFRKDQLDAYLGITAPDGGVSGLSVSERIALIAQLEVEQQRLEQAADTTLRDSWKMKHDVELQQQKVERLLRQHAELELRLAGVMEKKNGIGRQLAMLRARNE